MTAVVNFLKAVTADPRHLDGYVDGDISSLTRIATRLGYNVNEEDLENELNRQLVPLNDNEVDLVAAASRVGNNFVYTSSNVSVSSNVNAVSNAYVVTQVIGFTVALAAIQVF